MLSDNAWLDVAENLGFKLCRDAIWARDECTWLGWRENPDTSITPTELTYQSVGPDLYSGTAGIALFLGRLYSQSHDKLLRTTVNGCARHLMRSLDRVDEQFKAGLYLGYAGIAYALVEIGRCIDEQQWVDDGHELLLSLSGSPSAPPFLDIVSGSAGAILASLSVHSILNDDKLVESAVGHADNLLSHAEESDRGFSWCTSPGEHSEHLLGYAHGTSGIATALFEIASVTGEERFFNAAGLALRYENSFFDMEKQDWPDVRNFESISGQNRYSFSPSWCHGSPGIAISRLRILELGFETSAASIDARNAVEMTKSLAMKQFVGGHDNMSLCHGYGGNADVLIEAARVIGDEKLWDVALAVGANARQVFHINGRAWPCGNSFNQPTPGMMTGISGIGYFFLRLYNPEMIPSVLSIHV